MANVDMYDVTVMPQSTSGNASLLNSGFKKPITSSKRRTPSIICWSKIDFMGSKSCAQLMTECAEI